MKRTIGLVIFSAALVMHSCGGNDDEREVTQGRFPESDYNKELNDASIRFVDSSHELRYNRGGIMFMHSSGADKDTVSLLDTDSGSEIKLSWRGSLKKGTPSDAVLSIDGVNCPQHRIEVMQENTKGVWFRIQTPDGNSAVMVIGRFD